MKVDNFEFVSHKDVEIVTQTHARLAYSFLRFMVVHFEEVRLSMYLENFVDRETNMF